MKINGHFRYLACAIAVATVLSSCSTYSVSKELSDNSALQKIKSAYIVLRISSKGRIGREEQSKNLSNWLAAAKQTKKLVFLHSCDENVCSYSLEDDRFYQVDDKGRFLKYKSRGVVNEYVRSNEATLKKILDDNESDGIIIYEVYGLMTLEMQFLDFDSAICILDQNLKPVYLDRQFDSFNVNEISAPRVKQQLLDRISERLVNTLDNMGFLKR